MATPVTEVPYIGEKTERELRKIVRDNRATGRLGDKVSINEAARLWNGEGSVLAVKLGKRQRKELAKALGRGETTFLTRTERRQESTSTSVERDPEGKKVVGDFAVQRNERREAYEQHQSRSDRARDVDNQNRAPITTNLELWQKHPDQYDFPGIDTPKRKERIQDKDKPFVEPGRFARFDDEGDDEDDFGFGIPEL